jgi:preprotein translocase subunit SecD
LKGKEPLKKISWRLVFILAVFTIAVIYVLPTFKPSLWPHNKINLGLDLQGGMHLVLEVETDKAVESTIERFSQEISEMIKKENLPNVSVSKDNGSQLSVRIADLTQEKNFQKLMDKEFRDLRMVSRTQHADSVTMIFDLPEEEARQIKNLSVQQALETIRNRIDQFGVSEPDIRIQGINRILIQLPGVTDTQRAKDLIGKTAVLEFKLVNENIDPEVAERNAVPAGSAVYYQVHHDPATNREVRIPYVLIDRTLLTGAYLTDARVQIDSQFNEPYVSITFDRKGGRIFERITGENVKKRLAIVLDNRVYSAPLIQERISGGEARITGNFTTEEARDLAIVLRAGALPAPVKILEERTVGPSLGADSIRKGLISMMVGGILVLIFMVIYYQASGIVANIALVLNILLIGAGLAAFQATLTLPGIAGIILTIGMAVDANVIIFERIREELNIGKTPRSAVDAGYERSALTILDANVTLLLQLWCCFSSAPVLSKDLQLP